MKDLVSIITPGWNGVKFVHRLLNSILNQTYTCLEYIYVDDGSDDGTKEVVLSYAIKFEQAGIRFKYIYQQNSGVSAAINNALKYVTGKYLCWPEYDDFLSIDSVEKKVLYLEEHPDCAVVTSDAWIVYEKDLSTVKGLLSHKNPNRFDRNHFVQLLLSDSIFTAGCHMLRMDLFDKTHLNREIFPARIGPNWQILLPLYYNYNRGFIEEPLLYYQIRSSSISHSHKGLTDFLNVINSYIEILDTTLDQIPMPHKDRMLYRQLVNLKYTHERLLLAFKYRNKLLFKKQYSILAEMRQLKKKEIFLSKMWFFSQLYVTRKCLLKLSCILDDRVR